MNDGSEVHTLRQEMNFDPLLSLLNGTVIPLISFRGMGLPADGEEATN